jgi:Glycosyl transferase family 2
MTGAPAVSVVMPVRNAETYVGSAIGSICAQTLREVEVIVVDDGSTDSTAPIVREIARTDERVRLEQAGESGIVAALNHGCALARARLIARMDADDISHPHRLERQVDVLSAVPDAVLVATSVDVIDAIGSFVGTRAAPRDFRRALESSNPVVHSTAMFRAEKFRAVGGYRAEYAYAEDYDLWLRLARVGELVWIDEPLLAYRVHATQISGERARVQARAALAAYADFAGRPPYSSIEVDGRAAVALGELASFALDTGDLTTAQELLAQAEGLGSLDRATTAALALQTARVGRRQGQRSVVLRSVARAVAASPLAVLALVGAHLRRAGRRRLRTPTNW